MLSFIVSNYLLIVLLLGFIIIFKSSLKTIDKSKSDRIRELLRKKGTVKNREELADLANDSLNQVLSRSITTTVTTLMPVIALIFLGAHEIYNFNIALFIGLLAGTISSLFIAAPIWYDLEKHVIGKPKKKKWYE